MRTLVWGLLGACAPRGGRAPVDPALAERVAADGDAVALVALAAPAGDPRDLDDWLTAIAQAQDAALACAGLDRGDLRRDYDAIPALSLRVDAARLARLQGCPGVLGVQANHTWVPHLSESVPLIEADLTHAELGWDGTGTAVAILDTGVSVSATGLGGCFGAGCKVVDGYDFADDDADPSDCHGHGTNVSAIAAGTYGVAPGAEILAYTVFGGGGCDSSADEDIADALDEVVLASADHTLAAVNMSLGTEGYTTSSACDRITSSFATTAAFNTVAALDLVMAISAGNDGQPLAVSYPACLEHATVVANSYDANVGAGSYCTDHSCAGWCTDNSSAADQIQCTSNGGALIDLAAPGTFISAGDQVMGGTSQAAPHVAGAAALLKQAFPTASGEQLRRWVVQSEDTVTDDRTGDDVVYPRLNTIDMFHMASADDLTVVSWTIDDSDRPPAQGDGDGHAERGETVAISLELSNSGPGIAQGVVLGLSSVDPNLLLTTASAPLGNVGASATATDALSLTVLDTCAENTTADLRFTLRDYAGNSASQAESLPIHCVPEPHAEAGAGAPVSDLPEPIVDSAPPDSAALDSAAPDSDPPGATEGGRCGCGAAGSQAPSGAHALSGLALALVIARRRARRG